MGLLNFWKKNNSSDGPDADSIWEPIADPAEVPDLFNSEGPCVIYKHSYTCAICMFSKKQLETVIMELSSQASFYFVDVHRQRAVSDKVAETSGVRHESPQVLLFADGKVQWHASHGAITGKELAAQLHQLSSEE